MAIHRAATAFGAVAGEYERGRPDYPADAVAFLVDALGIGPGSTVVDLAAGTGKLTRLLVPSGAHLIAVEPVPGMRRILEEAVPDVEAVDGTAEKMPLADSSADAVVVGQAFHWFRGHEALAEIHRVLAPGGRLGISWNRRDLSQPLQAEVERIVDPHRGDTPSLATGAWRVAFEGSEWFGPLSEAHFAMAQTLDAQGLVDRMSSVSFIAGLPDPERLAVADALRALVRRHGGGVVLDYVTDCYWAQAR